MHAADSYSRLTDDQLEQVKRQLAPLMGRMTRLQIFEMADFLIARAPEPVVILAQDNDFFDPRGTAETFADVAHIYRLLGAEDRARLVFGEGPHSFGTDAREQMYG
uniref:hypothetical protein n=1 Tax=uncultured Brevundimonas sp. TaxID=213418 RepID=UPI002637259B